MVGAFAVACFIRRLNIVLYTWVFAECIYIILYRKYKEDDERIFRERKRKRKGKKRRMVKVEKDGPARLYQIGSRRPPRRE